MVTLDKIYHASYVLKDVVIPTPLVKASAISDDCEIYLKPENLQITGSFKVRGSGYKIAMLSDEEKKDVIDNIDTYSLDDKVTQKPIMMASKKEVFTGIKSPEISSSHTIKYTTPSTHIVNVDRKFDMSKMHTEYFQNKTSTTVP